MSEYNGIKAFQERAKQQKMNSAQFNLFSTEAQRRAEAMEGAEDIQIDLIDNFPNHPYLVKEDESMANLIDSIIHYDLIEPIIIRPSKETEGRYQVISGHRRLYAHKCLNKDTIKAYVRDLDDDVSIIMMVDSNIHRDEILPSEKAHAYKMRNDAIKRQAGRFSKNGDPVGPNLKTSQILANDVNESATQIKRYIRLNWLIPDLLDLCDKKALKLRPAVELSYLPDDIQEMVYDVFWKHNETMPTYDQARELRTKFEGGAKISESDLQLMTDSPAVEKLRRNFKVTNRCLSLIPIKYLKTEEREEYTYKALKYYKEHHKDE